MEIYMEKTYMKKKQKQNRDLHRKEINRIKIHIGSKDIQKENIGLKKKIHMEQRHTPRGINMGSENKHGEQKHT